MSGNGATLLAVDGLTVRFGGLTAVDGVHAEVAEGEIVGLIGPNGAGKTTTFNAVLGSVPLAEGRVELAGHDVTRWATARRARLGVARTFQNLEVFGSMTVRENLAFATEAVTIGSRPVRLLTRGRHRDLELVDRTIDQLGLDAVADEPAGALSTGTSRLVELGRALCARPRLLLLDEPSSGLDPAETREFSRHVRKAATGGDLGVLLIEHDMSLVTDLCERLYVLEFGRLIAAGTTDEVVRSDAVRTAYLGVA
ncbi:MAG: hypothetical protein JWP02_3729 [Acidimicrobiales bacterium]|nr:hypothetical protein [Acidimicrobiales bacterium]